MASVLGNVGRHLLGSVGGSLIEKGVGRFMNSGFAQKVGGYVGRALPFLKTIGKTVADVVNGDMNRDKFKEKFDKVGRFVDDVLPKAIQIKDGESIGGRLQGALSNRIYDSINGSGGTHHGRTADSGAEAADTSMS